MPFERSLIHLNGLTGEELDESQAQEIMLDSDRPGADDEMRTVFNDPTTFNVKVYIALVLFYKPVLTPFHLYLVSFLLIASSVLIMDSLVRLSYHQRPYRWSNTRYSIHCCTPNTIRCPRMDG
jgi:hypothetical protein